ncbi:DUF6049 family protein [Streptacidiphilus sp. EB129]|uniref:DUF6049 family protein n=1 Tax=Streptacidiphilus sp. EB129 TaxID=3156262 RepID=UPI003519BA35
MALRGGTVLLASGLTIAGGTSLAPALGPARYQTTASPVLVGQVSKVTGRSPGSVAAAPRAAGSRYPAVVSLSAIDPPVPQAKGTIRLTGTVMNSGSTPISGLQVGVKVDPDRLGTRGQIADIASLSTPNDSDPPALTAKGATQSLGTLAPGATSSSFSLTVAISDMNLSMDSGVYALAVDATGSVNGSSPAQDLGIARTFLPLFSATDVKPTQIATLWPMVDTPRVQPQTYTDGQQPDQPVLANDDLTNELGADGRLGQLQSIGSSIAALKPTWVIDPDLVNTVVAMSGNYRVATGNDTKGATPTCACTQAGTGGNAASTWLKGMQTAVAGLDGRQVLSLPTGDPDIASIARGTQQTGSLAASLKAAGSDLGQIGLNPLQVSADHSVAWPYEGYLDKSVVALARSAGATEILANSASLPDSLTYTPNAARSLGGGVTAVAADSVLSSIFAGDLSSHSAQILAEQRFLAETLAITEERPSEQRDILVQPPRDMSASTAQTLANALKAAVDGKWATPVPYGTVEQAQPTKDAGTSIAAYPGAVASSQLSSDALAQVAGVQQGLTQLEKILSRPDKLNAAFNGAVLRSVSTQWRDQGAAGEAYRDNTSSYLDSLQGAVSILLTQGTTVTLPGSGKAKIPITVGNDLQQTVLKLEVRLSSDASPARLNVDDPDTQPVTAQGGTKPTVRFTVTASANGQYQMVAQLYTTADGRPYGEPVVFYVDVTSLPSGVIAVMVGGGLLVVLAALRLYWKRRKNAALEAAAAQGPTGTVAGTGNGDGKSARHNERNAP